MAVSTLIPFEQEESASNVGLADQMLPDSGGLQVRIDVLESDREILAK